MTDTSNSALLEEVTSKFILAASTTCSTTAANLLVCDLADVIVYKCSGTLSCGNTAKVQTTSCDAEGVDRALAAAFNAAPGISQDQLTSMATIVTPLDGGNNVPSFANPAQAAAAYASVYITNRCFLNSYTRQAVGFPLVVLQDCSGVTVSGLNTLDASTRCAVGALSELIPPDPVLLGKSTAPALPIWENPLKLTLLVGGAAILLVLLAGAGIFLRATAYDPQPMITYTKAL